MIVQSYDQVAVDADDGLHIRLWALNENNEPCLIRVEDYYYSIYVKVPDECLCEHTGESTRKGWHKAIEFALKPWGTRKNDNNPFEVTYEWRKPFYFYSESKQLYCLLKFRTKEAMTFAKLKISKGVKNGKYGQTIQAEVLEDGVHGINPCLKLFAEIEIPPAEWLNVPEDKKITRDEDKISTLENEFLLSYKDLKKVDDDKLRITKPLTMSYDIETYSSKERAFPNANRDPDVCFMIGCTFERLGLPESRRKVCIYIGEDLNIEGVESIACLSEKDLLIEFFDLINRESPILMIGYNIGNFDNGYISDRCYRCNVNRCVPSLLKKNDAKRFVTRFNTKDCVLFSMSGRISIDLLMYMKRVYPSMTKHSLEFVSQHFLGEGKNDMVYSELFAIYRRYRVNMLRTNESIDEKTILFSEKEWKGKHPSVDGKTCIEEYRDIILYAVQDTVLPLRLMEKLKIWTAQVELSKLMYVSLEILLTQGEQVRSYSQLYNMQHNTGFVLNVPKFPKMVSNGGLVTEPLGGLHHDELGLDFASLYPSIMRSHNISYDTIVDGDDIKSGKVSLDKVDIHDFSQDECIPPDGVEMPNKNTKKWFEYLKVVEYTMYIIKDDIRDGQLPVLMGSLKEERTALRRKIKEYQKEIDKLPIHPPGHPDYDEDINAKAADLQLYIFIYDARQLSMKVSMNAVYGTLKVNKGAKISFPHLAQLITAKGRNHIRKCNDYLSHRLCDLVIPMVVKSMDEVPENLKKYKLNDELNDKVQYKLPENLKKYKLDDESTYDKTPYPTFLEIEDRSERTLMRTQYANSRSDSIDHKTGVIVYNDTDSVYCRFPWLKSADVQSFGELLSNAFKSHIFGDHLILEFEQALYVAIHLMKKMYTAIVMDPKTGKPEMDPKTGRWVTYTKGLCNAKRDGSKVQRDILTDMSYSIMCGHDIMTTLSIMFNHLLKLIRREVDYTELSYMVKMGEDYALDNYPMSVFKDELISRGKQVHTGEKFDFCTCFHVDHLDTLLIEGRRRKIPLGKTYWLNEEIKAGQAPMIDYVLYMDKIGSRLDDFFENVYSGNEFLSKFKCKRERGRKIMSMCRPFEYFSTLVYEAEDACAIQYINNKVMESGINIYSLKPKEQYKLREDIVSKMSSEEKYKIFDDIILPEIAKFIESKMDDIMA